LGATDAFISPGSLRGGDASSRPIAGIGDGLLSVFEIRHEVKKVRRPAVMGK
jgi:hypothetical protein